MKIYLKHFKLIQKMTPVIFQSESHGVNKQKIKVRYLLTKVFLNEKWGLQNDNNLAEMYATEFLQVLAFPTNNRIGKFHSFLGSKLYFRNGR